MKKTLPLTLNGEIVGSVEMDTETLEMVATVEDERALHWMLSYDQPRYPCISLFDVDVEALGEFGDFGELIGCKGDSERSLSIE